MLGCGHACRHHRSFFGDMFDEMDTLMQQPSNNYSIHQTEAGIAIKLDTGEKLPVESIDIQTSDAGARIVVAGQTSKTRITLQQEKNHLMIGVSSHEATETSAGSSRMQQVIPARVNFEGITAEYQGTLLTIAVPAHEPIATKTRKVAVSVKEDQVETHVKKHKNTKPEADVAPEIVHEK